MAAGFVIDGKAQVLVDTGTSNALEELGYTINGVEIEEQPFQTNIPTDENGGDEGPPSGIQYLGEIHIVRTELSKFDTAVLDKLDPKVYGGTTGQTSTPGQEYFGNSLNWRLLIKPTPTSPVRPRNYLGAIIKRISRNKGTKFTRAYIEWECHAISGVLFNTTTS